MSKIKTALKTLKASDKKNKEALHTIISFCFDEGVMATKASHINYFGFNNEHIEAKKQELIKQL